MLFNKGCNTLYYDNVFIRSIFEFKFEIKKKRKKKFKPVAQKVRLYLGAVAQKMRLYLGAVALFVRMV